MVPEVQTADSCLGPRQCSVALGVCTITYDIDVLVVVHYSNMYNHI